MTVEAIMMYAVITEPHTGDTTFTTTWPYWSTDLTEVYRRLDAIEQKLDELLARTAPEADVVDDIRKRVMDAIDRAGPGSVGRKKNGRGG